MNCVLKLKIRVCLLRSLGNSSCNTIYEYLSEGFVAQPAMLERSVPAGGILPQFSLGSHDSARAPGLLTLCSPPATTHAHDLLNVAFYNSLYC